MLSPEELNFDASQTSMSMAGGSLAHIEGGLHTDRVTSQSVGSREVETGVSL